MRTSIRITIALIRITTAFFFITSLNYAHSAVEELKSPPNLDPDVNVATSFIRITEERSIWSPDQNQGRLQNPGPFENPGPDERPNTYVITVTENDYRTIHIEAEIQLEENSLSMNWPSADFLEKGWAQFIENIEFHNLEGEPIEANYTDKANWTLNTNNKRVKLVYDIDLTHDRTQWEQGGHSAAAYLVQNVIYSIGAALFIANPEEELLIGTGPAAQVYFDLPPHFEVAVPWKKLEGEALGFEVNSTYELIRSGMSFGELSKSARQLGGMEVTIATAADFKEVIPKFEEIYTEVVPVCVDYFDSALDSRYVVIANNAPKTEEFQPYFSGEALHQTMSLISPIVPTDEYMPLFWYILTHEYLHHWMGITIQADPQEQAWFMEGFTDYISWHVLRQVGRVPDEMILNGFGFGPNSIGWGENIKKYLKVAGKVSMVEAGQNKQENYDMIYSGGSLFALLLEVEMNQVTDGKIGLKELMQEINRRFGEGSGKLLSNADIEKIASELCGKDLNSLFERYVEGTEVMPIETYLNKMGIRVESFGTEDQHLGMDPAASAEQTTLLDRVIGRE